MLLFCGLLTVFRLQRGWFSHPIYKGDYPPVMREWVDRKCKKEGRPWSILPTFTEDEIQLIKGWYTSTRIYFQAIVCTLFIQYIIFLCYGVG